MEHCLHNKYHRVCEAVWPVIEAEDGAEVLGKAKYACMGCTDNRRACLVWDPERKEVVVLPLAPKVRNAREKPEGGGDAGAEEVVVEGMTERNGGDWVRDVMGFTTRFAWAKDMFGESVRTERKKKVLVRTGGAGAEVDEDGDVDMTVAGGVNGEKAGEEMLGA